MVLSEDDTKKSFREDVAKRARRSVPSICRTRWPERGDKRPGDKDDTNWVAELIGTSSGLRKHASFINVTYNNDHPLLKYGGGRELLELSKVSVQFVTNRSCSFLLLYVEESFLRTSIV